MSRLPTVTLLHKKHGKIIVNESDYAVNIGGWVDDGWKRVAETDHGEPPNIVTEKEELASSAPLVDVPGVPAPEPKAVPPKRGDEVHAVLKGGTKVHLVKVLSVNKKDGTFTGTTESGQEKEFAFDQLVEPEPPSGGESER